MRPVRRRAFFVVSIAAAAGAAAVIAATLAAADDPVTPLTNAAAPRYGARLSVSPAKGGSRDPNTAPEATFDGNAHTRCVLRDGTPYTFTIELPARLPIDRIAFAHSDYANEQAPKEIQIALDDGTILRPVLELKRPEGRRPAWQEVPVGKEARVLKITVLSNHVPDAKVNWGGLAEIAVLTSADLETRLKVPGYDPSVPAFVHTAAPTVGGGGIAAAKPRLPAPARPGEHPRLLLTRQEIGALKTALQASERGKKALASLISLADGALTGALNFPDPKGPLGQIKDRGDEIAKRHDRLSLNAGTLGFAYALTGNEAYARRAAEILRGYAERYAAYPEHKGVNRNDTGKVMGQRLSEAMWLIPLIEAYDYIYDSPGALTAEDKAGIESQLVRPAIAFIRRKVPADEAAERDRANKEWRTAFPRKGTAANWLLYYNTATIMAGSVLGDRDMIDLAAADFRFLLANGIGSDGMWDEGAIGYQFFALMALVPGMETAAHQGIDLWGFDNSRVKRLFDSPLLYAYPDGSAPGINDSGRSRFGDWSTMSYDYAFLRYGDAGYAFLVNASPRQLQMSQAVYFPTRLYDPLPEPKATTYPSTVFESLGYAVLRHPAKTYALMDYGPHGGTHGHRDKLNLILFFATGAADGKGDEMGGEPRFHRYEDPLHGEWTTQTVAHNTLTVDETSQTASAGRLLVFEDTPTLKVMRAETAASVPGAVLDRTVIVTPDAVLDLYRGRSAFRRTWDRTLRFQGKMAGFPVPGVAAAPPPLGARDGYQRLRVASRKPAAESPWQGVWQTTTGAFQATVASAPGQQMILALGPDEDHLALARQEGEQADFVVTYALETWQNPVQAVRSLPTGDPNLVAVEMTQRDGTKTTVFVAHGKVRSWQALGWRSDARVLCLRQSGKDAKTVEALLTGGTFAEGKQGSIRRDAPGNYRAQRRGEKFEIVSAWTKGS